MQPIKYLQKWFENNANQEHYLYSLLGIRALFPSLSDSAFKTLISRAVKSGTLTRACRGIYLYKNSAPSNGLVLFHIAALLRTQNFNYISLETVLSDLGIISQVPINWVTIMSSGRSATISCGKLGTIEFIHTVQKPEKINNQIKYDQNCKLWRATPTLALRDMRATRRNMDLIDWDIANELI